LGAKIAKKRSKLLLFFAIFAHCKSTTMKKILTTIFAALLLISATAQTTDYASLVNPLIGTDYKGNVYPGAQAPFGMVQLSPDNGLPGWDRIAG
jgi:putative alpha-1,2-mannosidase